MIQWVTSGRISSDMACMLQVDQYDLPGHGCGAELHMPELTVVPDSE